MRGDTHQAPPGGQIKTAPPASGPRLRRPPRGAARPRPPGLRPLARLRAPGPRCLGHPAGGGSGTGATVAGVGNRLRLSMPDAQLPGGFRASGEIQRGPCRGTAGFGGVPPVVGRRWATRPRRWAARVQPLAAVPAVHGLGEVVHGRPGYRAHLFGRALEKTGVFLGEPRKAVFPGCGSESALRVFNWKLIS